jgi:histidine ammonia-lyase
VIPDIQNPAATTIIPDGENLSVDSIPRIARDPSARIELTPEIRQMCMPMSIQPLPSTDDFQDHVSFGPVAARRTRDIPDIARHILAFELPCACQAADFRGVDKLGSATRKLYDIVRKYVPYLDHDEPLTNHIEKIASLFASGEVLVAVPQEVDTYNW